MPRPRSRLTLPKEHGATVTCAGALAAALFVSPAPVRALGASLVLVAAFLLRPLLERRAVALPPRRWDAAAAALLLAFGAAGGVLASPAGPAVTGLVVALALATLAGGVLGRLARRHREAWFESAGMAGLGAGAGAAALAGGTSATVAAALGIILAVHSALAVPLVRLTLRRGPRQAATPGVVALVSSLTLAGTALGVAWLAGPPVALALAPRAAGLAWRTGPGSERTLTASVLGIQESAGLAAAVALAAVLL